MAQQQIEQPDDATPDYMVYWNEWTARFGDAVEGPAKTPLGTDIVLKRLRPDQFHKMCKSWGYLHDEWNGLFDAVKMTTADNPLYAWAQYRLGRLDAEIDFLETRMLIPGARQ